MHNPYLHHFRLQRSITCWNHYFHNVLHWGIQAVQNTICYQLSFWYTSSLLFLLPADTTSNASNTHSLSGLTGRCTYTCCIRKYLENDRHSAHSFTFFKWFIYTIQQKEKLIFHQVSTSQPQRNITLLGFTDKAFKLYRFQAGHHFQIKL